MDVQTTTDVDATISSGLFYFCAVAVAVAETVMVPSLVETVAVRQSGSSCFCVAAADVVQTTITAVAASENHSDKYSPTFHKISSQKTGGMIASGFYISVLLYFIFI